MKTEEPSLACKCPPELCPVSGNANRLDKETTRHSNSFYASINQTKAIQKLNVDRLSGFAIG
jgi:hypothetical protein